MMSFSILSFFYHFYDGESGKCRIFADRNKLFNYASSYFNSHSAAFAETVLL